METSTWQHTTLKRYRHSFPQRDSNTQWQQESGWRPTPYIARPLDSPAFGMGTWILPLLYAFWRNKTRAEECWTVSSIHILSSFTKFRVDWFQLSSLRGVTSLHGMDFSKRLFWTCSKNLWIYNVSVKHNKIFIMFIVVLGQYVSILIESSSGPSKIQILT